MLKSNKLGDFKIDVREYGSCGIIIRGYLVDLLLCGILEDVEIDARESEGLENTVRVGMK